MLMGFASVLFDLGLTKKWVKPCHTPSIPAKPAASLAQQLGTTIRFLSSELLPQH